MTRITASENGRVGQNSHAATQKPPTDNRQSRGSGGVTLNEVARHARVSAMTVSRVINGNQRVRPATRALVQSAIEALRYSPNTAARALAGGTATHVGLLYSNPSAAYLSQFLVGALDCARHAGCHLVIEACESSDDAAQVEAVRRLIDAKVQGVLLPPPQSESVAILAELAAAQIPIATVAMGKSFSNRLNVRIDDFAAAKEITEHLIALGHRRIGFIRGHSQQIASRERERGFRAAVAEAGIGQDMITMVGGDFTFRSGLNAGERLLRRVRRPTAIFASNDEMAAAVIATAHRMGLTVPSSLSVTGFDDTGIATTVWPELTTIRQPVASMARDALEILLHDMRRRRRRSEPPTVDKVLAHKLVLRDSCAPPTL